MGGSKKEEEKQMKFGNPRIKGIIHGDINRNKGRHSRPCFRGGKLVPGKAGSGNPGKDWIPGQARNDKPDKTYVVVYRKLNLK